MAKENILKGGEFLIKETKAADIFIPEEFTEEQLMIAQTCSDFLEQEVYPNLDRIDAQEEGLMRWLLQKAGELGLLGISVPEQYEGFDQNFVTSMLASEYMGAGYSFSVAYSAHTGIGTLPIVYYGNEEQKQKYIPRLATGELTSAYCLTEPGAGSDANSAKTQAVLTEDGKHYLLNGQKMWITNGGFADVMTVFAKIDNDRVLSAFIVERNFPGIKFNPEEKKMGIKGSSTVQIFFNDCKVPVENLLGKRGQGFRIALNILHMGRIKLGGTVLGAAKRAITQSVNYANERKQFNTPIASFGAIQHKLAEQVIKTWVTEASVYRVSANIDDTIAVLLEQGRDKGEATIEGIAQYAIEAAFLKVFGSEALNYIVDEAVQIFGGMGFSSETPIDRAYRDSRINRIFEGTNEINRMLVVDTTIKKALKEGFDVSRYSRSVLNEFEEQATEKAPQEYFEEKRFYVRNFKKAALLLLGVVSDTFKRTLTSEQEILFNVSDIIMQVYASESALLRLEKLESLRGAEAVSIYRDIVDVFIYEAADLIRKNAVDAINSFAEGEERQKLVLIAEKLSAVAPVNTKEARRRLAAKVIDDNKYDF
ncbi:MAG: acyl-CoA dehydrogenase family protein [Bacteroidales bacterium]|jgi:alkylation response protein AidB-like acyl-CoA dehydrogenase|nr:acyl-CoA dehydrogenase family protein [Bacteroidales bacterium]NCU36254.1 acyl-CoA dehydrogenase [Candidatus Falkowbacteria bacterium]MDD3131174.1 acyl-CoA dehydrogenase family protein [Bacteroidales bacterium]MDD4178215.1 acyl-CoA dehydrogenase family protein [Bacteroidales bacterium]MDD4742587.1 acyl-CoA dehydrogenase family protein [Bacteroidales bacterium]